MFLGLAESAIATSEQLESYIRLAAASCATLLRDQGTILATAKSPQIAPAKSAELVALVNSRILECGGTVGGGGTTCAASGKVPLASQACCTGLIKDSLGICNAPSNTPSNTAVCVGTYVCSIPDMYLYVGVGLLAFMMMKK